MALDPIVDPGEKRKRRRERVTILFLGLLVLVLAWAEIKLFGISQQLPFVHSIFFFGLVNFNIILVLLMFFLVFRNIAKVFVERQGKVIGSTLKGKLIAAFVAFSTIPTVLMLLVSVFYINSSFDKWFNVKMAGVLKSSMDVTNTYYFDAKKKNYHFAQQIASQLGRQKRREIPILLEKAMTTFSLDSVEYYPDLFAERIVVVPKSRSIPDVPSANLEFLKKGLGERIEASTLHYFGEGNLIRVIVPVEGKANRGAVVVSSFVPLSLISRMDEINTAYEEFRNVNPIEYPIKSIYLTILLLMALVIFLCATWVAVYLARQLSVPLESLGKATKRVSKGDFQPVSQTTGSMEMSQLIDNFNRMTRHLAESEAEVQKANNELKETMQSLDEHSRYVEVVLSNVSTGVIAVDEEDRITTINLHAGHLLKIDPDKYVGRNIKDLLSAEYHQLYNELLKTMKAHRAESLQKEIRVNVAGKSVPMQMSLSLLHDEKGKELGKVMVFDDLTMLVNAQRAQAWTEVARRIAHEIKNPLTPIRLSAQRLQKKFGESIEDSAFEECTSMIIKQTDDLKGLVNEFSQFARLPQSKPVVASLDRVIEDALALYKNAQKPIEFSFEKDAELPEFKFDPEQIRRVLVNLIDNSIAALSGRKSPKIAIQTSYDSLLKIVRIVVADNGPGISEFQRERVFEPYFSTKKHGTGLGLAIVKRIVEDHNGFVRAFANDPKGLRMVIELPVIEGPKKESFVSNLRPPKGELNG